MDEVLRQRSLVPAPLDPCYFLVGYENVEKLDDQGFAGGPPYTYICKTCGVEVSEAYLQRHYEWHRRVEAGSASICT